MNNSRKTFALAQLCVRHISKSAARRAEVTEVTSSKFGKLKETQKFFGVEDNVPVHLKGGFSDKILYQSTWVLTLIGMGMVGETLFKLAYK